MIIHYILLIHVWSVHVLSGIFAYAVIVQTDCPSSLIVGAVLPVFTQFTFLTLCLPLNSRQIQFLRGNHSEWLNPGFCYKIYLKNPISYLISSLILIPCVLQETLDSLISKIDSAKDKWEEKATLVQVNNKHVLMEFGLNPLEL